VAFVAHHNSVTWVMFWILLAAVMLQCLLFLGAAIRGGQLEHQERKLGYTTWARKR